MSIVLCDHEGRVLYVDPALGEMVRALCGVAPAALVGKPGGEIWPPFIWDPLEASLRKAVETGQRQIYDLAFTLPTGEVNYRHWIVLPLAGQDGQVHRVLGINHDVTSERRLLDELRAADRRKSEFIGVLSHELRNPLSAIRTALYVLEQEDAPGDSGARREAPGGESSIARSVTSCASSTISSTSRASRRTRSSSSGSGSTLSASCARRSRTTARTSRRAA